MYTPKLEEDVARGDEVADSRDLPGKMVKAYRNSRWAGGIRGDLEETKVLVVGGAYRT